MPQKPYHQACALQRLCWALAHDPNTKPNSTAALVRVWKELEEQKRVMKMKPRPKDIDVEKLQRIRRKAPQFLDVDAIPILPDVTQPVVSD
jgi:hypothetical protein